MRLLIKILVPALVMLFSACSPDSGPVEIKYDRDVCEACGMIISSPRYAAELRLASDNRPHKFDDIGDALTWLEKQCLGPEAAREIWVMNSDDGKTWLDARSAFYRRGKSPMNYDFAAVAGPTEGALDFAAMRSRAVRKEANCAPGEEKK